MWWARYRQRPLAMMAPTANNVTKERGRHCPIRYALFWIGAAEKRHNPPPQRKTNVHQPGIDRDHRGAFFDNGREHTQIRLPAEINTEIDWRIGLSAKDDDSQSQPF
jgi:hypothetical protein